MKHAINHLYSCDVKRIIIPTFFLLPMCGFNCSSLHTSKWNKSIQISHEIQSNLFLYLFIVNTINSYLFTANCSYMYLVNRWLIILVLIVCNNWSIVMMPRPPHCPKTVFEACLSAKSFLLAIIYSSYMAIFYGIVITSNELISWQSYCKHVRPQNGSCIISTVSCDNILLHSYIMFIGISSIHYPFLGWWLWE